MQGFLFYLCHGSYGFQVSEIVNKFQHTTYNKIPLKKETKPGHGLGDPFCCARSKDVFFHRSRTKE